MLQETTISISAGPALETVEVKMQNVIASRKLHMLQIYFSLPAFGDNMDHGDLALQSINFNIRRTVQIDSRFLYVFV